METTDGAPSDQLTTGQMNEEVPSELIPASNPEGISKEDEDFLSGLNSEEKECLEYLLRTINTLDEDGDRHHEKMVDEGHHEKMADSLGSEAQCKSSAVDSGTQRSTSVEAFPTKPGPCQGASKIKMTKSLSEVSGDIPRGSPDPYCLQAKGPPRLAGSHPAHFRKFDTIMRSGVNVKELRSHFLLHLDSSAAAVREPTEDGAATIKQFGPLTGSQRSPRHEALQKLGLLQRNSSLPNMSSRLLPMAGQHLQVSLAESLNHETTASSINTTGEP